MEWDRACMCWGKIVILNRLVENSFTRKATFVQRLYEHEGPHQYPRKEQSRQKEQQLYMSKLGSFLVCLRNSIGVSMAGAEWTWEAQDEVREQTTGASRSHRALCIVRTLALTLRDMGGQAIRLAQSGLHFNWISLAAVPRITWRQNDKSRELLRRLNSIIQVAGDYAWSRIHSSGRVRIQTWSVWLSSVWSHFLGQMIWPKGHCHWMLLISFPRVTNSETYLC